MKIDSVAVKINLRGATLKYKYRTIHKPWASNAVFCFSFKCVPHA